jgi:hypothetical protein
LQPITHRTAQGCFTPTHAGIKANTQAKGSSTPSTPDAHFYKRIKRTNQRTTYFYPFIKIEPCCFPLGATTKRFKK